MHTRILLGLMLLSSGVGCQSQPTPLPMATTPEAANTAIKNAFEAWKQGKTAADLQALSPPVYLTDDGFLKGVKLVDYKLEGEGKTVGTGLSFTMSLTTQDGSNAPRTRKVAYRVVTTPNISISKEDFLP
jgi:hypothetical protein